MKPDWHRCSEILPDDNGVYLVFYEVERMTGVRAWSAGTCYIEADGEREKMGWAGGAERHDPRWWPSHWAVLPEGPSR